MDCDILLGGNLSRAKPETGIYCAGHGLFLKGMEKGAGEVLSLQIAPDSLSRVRFVILKYIKINGKQSDFCCKKQSEFTLLHFLKIAMMKRMKWMVLVVMAALLVGGCSPGTNI